MYRILLLCTGFLFGLCYTGQAQDSFSFTLSGQVLDQSDNSPLAGVAVAIPSWQMGTYTDAEGRFILEGEAKASTATIEVNFSSGYQDLKQKISLSPGENQINFSLQPNEFTTEDVVITAAKGFEQSQSDVTVSIEVVKPRFIDLQALPSVDEALNQIPGVDNQDGQLNIRGSSGYAYGVGSRVMVTLDGLPLITGDAGAADLDLIPIDNIQQIEVMKGASSVLYGSSALGGVINVITADPGSKPKTAIRLRGGMYGTPANPSLDWNGDANTFNGSAHAFHSRQMGPLSLTLQGNVIKDPGYRQNTDTEEYRGLAMLKFQPASIPGLTVGFNASISVDSSANTLYWEDYYADTTIVEAETLYSGGGLTPTMDAGAFRRQLQTSIALDPSVKYLTEGGSLFWYRGRLLRSNNQNNTGQSSTNWIAYNDFLYQKTLWDHINWVTGATVSYATIQGDSLYGGSYVYRGDTVESSGRHNSNSLGLYTQVDGKWGRFNASLGVRYESVQINDAARDALPVFRAGVNYEIAQGTNIRASVGQAFRVPSIAERFANTSGGGVIVEPNPGILPESGYSAELGFRQGFLVNQPGFKLKGFVDIAAFTMRYEDMVEFGVNSVVIRRFNPLEVDARFSSYNLADARINGVEYTHNIFMEAGDFFASWNGGVTWTDPRNLNAVSPDSQMNLVEDITQIFNLDRWKDQPEVLKYRSEWTVRSSISLGYGPASLTTNFRYKSFIENIDQYLYLVVQNLDDFRTFYPNGDPVFDFIFAYDVTKQINLSANLKNAFNREFLIIPGTLAPQRQLVLQMAWKF